MQILDLATGTAQHILAGHIREMSGVSGRPRRILARLASARIDEKVRI
jgi:hypothetical protein